MIEPYAYTWRSEAPFDNPSWPSWTPWTVEYDGEADRYRVMCGNQVIAIVGPTLVAHWMARTNNEAQERNRAAQEAARSDAARVASRRGKT